MGCSASKPIPRFAYYVLVWQVAALQSGGRDASDDESWGDELEKELEGEAEVGVSLVLSLSTQEPSPNERA